MTKRRWTWVWTTLFVFGLGACGGGNQSAIEGKLVDSDGKPVAGMRITASQVQPLKGYEQLESVSKADGTFRITGLFPLSTYVLKPPDEWNIGATVRIVSAPQGETALLPDPLLIVHAFCNRRSVRASNPNSAYIDHSDGTVTDTRTGLMWKQCAEGLGGAACQVGVAQTFNWANATAHAGASVFASYTDWRLPSGNELVSLVEECRFNPSINTNRFPNTPSSDFWSGSPGAYNSSFAQIVDFSLGNHNMDSSLNRALPVRLVRGGQ